MSQSKELHSTVICLRAGKVLLVRKEAPLWSLPGGKIDPGEEHLDAARRELNEETTLQLVNAEFLGHYDFETEEHYLYRMPVEPAATPHASDEIVQCRWFNVDELQQVAVKPTNIELLKQAGVLTGE